MKQHTSILFTITCLILTFSAVLPLPAQELPSITFSYAFLYRTSPRDIRTIDYTKSFTTLAPSDQLKLFLKPGPGTFLYLFLHDAEGDLFLIYPRYFADFNEQNTTGPGFYFPGGFEWLQFDENSGEERFYILGSAERLQDLEKTTNTFLELQEQNSKGKKYGKARKAVLEEIRRLQIEHITYVKKVKSEIAIVAGEFRGFEAAFEFPVCTITGVSFYARTIRIGH